LRPWVAGFALAGLVVGCVQLEYRERELTFRPSREAAYWFGGMPEGVREMYLPVAGVPDAQRMHAWWWPARDADAPVVLYLHGARWNLTGQVRRIEQLHRFGFSVFAIDYRGFGKSDGDLPSEESVYADALAAWKWLDQVQPDPSQRFIYGHSLGGAVAIDLAARLSANDIEAGGLIVESTFTNLADIAAAMSFAWLPTRLLLTQKFDSIDKIARVRMPVLIAHGASDRLVPAHFSNALYDAARGPKRLLLVEGASHNNTMIVGNDDYLDACVQLFGLATVDRGGAKIVRSRSRSL
jgi:fermentation-respiration switch protein FrsA (DUF1100 family)